MTTVLNYLISILALILLGWETYLVARRNRTIVLKGKDDFFTLCLVMLFAMLLLRPDAGAGFLESLRNTLVLMVIFFSMAVKRGLSERGIEKLGFVVPWGQLTAVHLRTWQTTKIEAVFSTEKRRYRLLFSKYQLKKLIFEIQKYYPDVMIEESLKVD